MKVRIFKPHTHAGTHYVPGPEGLDIEVPADAVRWLVQHAGAAHVAGPAANDDPPAATSPHESQPRERTPRAPADPST
jgi:hypothetical protein